MLYFGIRQGLRKIQPFEHGHATIGEVVDIYQDMRISINGRHPWAVVYVYRVHGIKHEGTELSWQPSAGRQRAGNRVHVLYMPDDPDESVIYPPVG